MRFSSYIIKVKDVEVGMKFRAKRKFSWERGSRKDMTSVVSGHFHR